ncbi:MAG: putative bifunctional diguanylate cyclase/phosphodiesterase [Synechococcus sp.]
MSLNQYSNQTLNGFMPFERFDSLTAEVLIVDDDRVNRMALARILQKAGYTVREAENGQVALQHVAEQPPNAIVLDINMPVLGGFETCSALKSDLATQHIPVIFISTLEDVSDKVRAFDAGGSDYITRPFQPQEVLARVASQIALQRQQQALQDWNKLLERQVKERTQTLEHMALYDSLTELPNRLHLLQELTRRVQEIEQQQEYGFALIAIDCDRFKVINDSLGHSEGDKILKAIGSRLRTQLPDSVFLARLGEDEFGAIVSNTTTVKKVLDILRTIRVILARPFELQPREVFIDFCAGITFGRAPLSNPEILMREADAAMYEAKRMGPGSTKLFETSMHKLASDRLYVENDLRQAIAKDELELYYQPIVSLRSGDIAGFEALVRWNHPERDMSPAEFIPVAEETGTISRIGLWSLRKACQQLREWQADREQPLSMSVNISARQLTHSHLLDRIDHLLASTPLNGGQLKLELTESALMVNPESARRLLQELRERDIQLCLDDFGTGYSSMSYLQKLPLNTLKIDQSFVREMGTPGGNPAIVQAIVTLAHSLGMSAIAEGVESAELMHQLQTMGCEYGQGYFFGKPLNAAETSELLERKMNWLGEGEA